MSLTDELIDSINSENIENIKRILMQPEFDVNLGDTNGYTPLMNAIGKKNINIIKLLLKKGADVNKATNNGITPLSYAIHMKSMYIIRLLLEKEADINKTDNDGTSPLMNAIHLQQINIIEILLDKGADVNIKDNNGNTALSYAILIKQYDIIKLLLEKEADVNIATNTGNTPLMLAIQIPRLDIVKLLLEKGADVNKATNNGITPLSYAILIKQYDIIKLLLEKGALESEKWDGTDTTKLNAIFSATPNNFSMCPVCLEFVEDAGTNMYISHKCSIHINDSVYYTYKNPEGLIQWCKICNRISSNNQHYKLIDYNSPKSVLLPSNFPEAKDCRINGGGGIIEKGQRFRHYLEYVFDMQEHIGILDKPIVLQGLLKEFWNAPLINNKAIIQNILDANKWDISLPRTVNAVGNSGRGERRTRRSSIKGGRISRRITNKKNRYNRK